jgi:hypothetical protein
MADWRQIQARIRKAKNNPDAQARLSQLYERTRDAMVAWEIGVIEEKAGRNDEAAKWYTVAAGRFRRTEWKKKAEEALVRLGVQPPVSGEEPAKNENAEPFRYAPDSPSETPLPSVLGKVPLMPEAVAQPEPVPQTSGTSQAAAGTKKKRRRGRRGGRGRRRKGVAAAVPALPSQAFAEPTAQAPPPRSEDPRVESVAVARRAPVGFPEPPSQFQTEASARRVPSERTVHGRAGDPALASRLAQLESMLRRLVASPLHDLDEATEAPAGPGVFLLSDSDLITSYYVEACRTLRIGIANLVRGGRGGKSSRGGHGYTESPLKAKLAEHLGISEAKVGQYLKDHCVVRWIQLDEDAPHLAHFAIGVLRTPLNID